MENIFLAKRISWNSSLVHLASCGDRWAEPRSPIVCGIASMRAIAPHLLRASSMRQSTIRFGLSMIWGSCGFAMRAMRQSRRDFPDFQLVTHFKDLARQAIASLRRSIARQTRAVLRQAGPDRGQLLVGKVAWSTQTVAVVAAAIFGGRRRPRLRPESDRLSMNHK